LFELTKYCLYHRHERPRNDENTISLLQRTISYPRSPDQKEHGFPVPIVAEDILGDKWVKYIATPLYKVTSRMKKGLHDALIESKGSIALLGFHGTHHTAFCIYGKHLELTLKPLGFSNQRCHGTFRCGHLSP